VDAHLSADQRHVQPKSRSSGEPVGIVPAWHGPSRAQTNQPAKPARAVRFSFSVRTHNRAAERTQQTNERPKGAGFGDSVLESMGHIRRCSLHPARQGWAGRSPISSSPVNLLFSRRLDRQSPHSKASRTSPRRRAPASSSKQATRRPLRGGRAPALWRLVGSLATCSRTRGDFARCLGIGTVSKSQHGTRERPASPATSKRPSRKLAAHVCAWEANIQGLV